MTMKILTAEDRSTEYYYKIHIDHTKLDKDGKPDPEYVMEFHWGKEPPEGQTDKDYLKAIKREMRLLAKHKLQEQRVSKLPDEGQIL